jgi:hypothetical protein
LPRRLERRWSCWRPALLLAVSFATLTSTAVFGALSSVVERVSTGGIRKQHANETSQRAERAKARRALAPSEYSLSRSRAEAARLNDDLRTTRVEADRLRGQVEAQRRRTSDVARGIKARTANVATVNAGSMLGEAASFLGIGIGVIEQRRRVIGALSGLEEITRSG